MFESPFIGGGDIPNEIWQKARNLPVFFQEHVEQLAQKSPIPTAAFPPTLPCNVWAVLDQRALHVAFSAQNAGGMPRKTWEDAREKGSISCAEIRRAANHNVGLVDPDVVSFPLDKIDASPDEQQSCAKELAERYVRKIEERLMRPQCPQGFEYLQPFLDIFSTDYPHFDRNVAIIMSFAGTPELEKVDKTVRSSLNQSGLIGHRADDKVYAPDGDLWNNVCVYLIGCKYGVAVFDGSNNGSTTPNVPLEYGFMRALNRRVLLLREKSVPNMPSDIIGKLYRPFDLANMPHSLSAEITEWVTSDLGIKLDY